MIYGVTGHRERKFVNKEKAKREIFSFLDSLDKSNLSFSLGGANGVDNWVAEWCIKNSVSYTLYLPFKNHSQQTEGWNKKQRKEYRQVIKEANNIVYGNGYFSRNRLIVDNSELVLCVLISGGRSGTKYTVDYARSKGKKVIDMM